jgi:hypothetical protein
MRNEAEEKLRMNANSHDEPGTAQLERGGRSAFGHREGYVGGQRYRIQVCDHRRGIESAKHRKLSKPERGIVRQFLAKVNATSRAQLTRLIGQWMLDRKIARKPANRASFTFRYRREDILLLAATDAAHEDLSGPALRRILHREFDVDLMPWSRTAQLDTRR